MNRKAIRAVATVLEAPRDRLGRLDIALGGDKIRAARETVREFAVKYDVSPSKDLMEQCAKVLRAVLAKVNHD